MKIALSKFFLLCDRKSFDWALLVIANALALCGGIILLLMVFVNVISITGRIIFGKPLVGDFELIEIACAVAIFLFLPLCQLKNGNIVVEVFTMKLSDSKKLLLDLIGDLIFAIIALFFSVRMVFGFQDMMKYNEETMLLEIPVWIPFIPAIFSFFFLSLICFYAALTKTSDLITAGSS
jgi:TRAP-type C4-dicarboxylate transport system permease small subunit